ncbi:hypothetical protein [Micromonospora sp. IBSANI012]
MEDGRPSGCLSARRPVSETSRSASPTSRPDQALEAECRPEC